MTEFKVGDKVAVLETHKDSVNTSHREFTVAYVKIDRSTGNQMVGSERDGEACWYSYRFKLVEATKEVKDTLKLSYGGVTIELDPSIPFSRKFAEVFLDVAYSN